MRGECVKNGRFRNSNMNSAKQGFQLSPANKLAVRCAIASLELLREASKDTGVPVVDLTANTLEGWILSQSAKG